MVSAAVAQTTTGAVSGVVVDESGGVLPDVTVRAASAAGFTRQTRSDASGAFVLDGLPTGTYTVTATRELFTPAEAKDVIVTASGTVTLRLELKVSTFVQTASVQAPAGQVDQVAPSTIEVSPLEVRSVAGAGENIYRVLQTLPGVAAVNDFDSRLTVRGGGPDQNLTMMDGVEIHNPYRLFGLTSAFNPETVRNFELTAGGFHAKYGDRLSSILVIENRDGTDASRLAGSANLSFVDANVVTEGALPGTDSGSWLLTGRRTYYDVIAEPLVDTNLPGFTDVQARAAWSPRPGQRLTMFALSSRERTDADFDGDVEGERLQLQSSTDNDLGAASFSSSFGARASSATTVSWYRNRETVAFDGNFSTGELRSNRPDEDAKQFSNFIFTRGVNVRDIAVRNETTVQASTAHLIETGFESHSLKTDWGSTIAGDRDNQPGGTGVVGAGLPSALDSSRSAWRAAAWLTDRWTLAPRLRVEPGLRVDWSGVADEVTASPRLAVVADISSALRLRVAGGLFTQSPGYEKLLQSDYFVDLSDANGRRLRSERAWHALAGVERTFSGGLMTRVEGYYKRFDRLIVGRLETADELAARIGTYDFPLELADQRPTAPLVTSTPGNDGTGRAYGVEFYVARQARSSTDRVSGWASYTWGRAETTAYGRTFVSDYDRPHALSLVGSYRVSRLIELASTVRVQSGFPYSLPLGVRVAATEDTMDTDGDGNVTEFVPRRDATGLPVWTVDYGDVGNLNSGRLPAFARVDLRVTFRPGWQSNRWLLYAEVINLLNRNNGELDAELAYDASSDRPRVTTVRDPSLPLLPSVGIRFRF
ncbi:MAG: TonB-dependent receptor [Acidobacteria bacterium]|nr:TonB-dependent receptor [Acidobacteriota bacterium]